jgi:RND superfamily putative drug exporter
MLRRITGFAIRRPVLVLLLWVAVVGVGYGVGTGVFGKLTSEVGTVPDSQSARVSDLLAAAAPGPEHLTAVVTGRLAADPAGAPALAAAVADVRKLPAVADIAPPRTSADGKALLFDITLRPDTEAQPVADRLRAVDKDHVVVAGGSLTDDDFGTQAQADVQRAETITMPIVLILLVLVFGGLIAAAVPLAVAAVAVGGTFGLLYAFSFASDVSVYSIQVATMLSIGLAVDYGLLLISRFREERATAPDVPAALARTMATAGRTVLFTGLTVAVCLAGVTVFPDAFLRSMGIAGAGVVVVDMLAALTLLPAILSLWGHRIAPAKPRTGDGVFGRLATLVQRRAVLTLVATAGLLVLLVAPAVHMRLSNSDARALPTTTQTRQLYDQLAAHFPDQVDTPPIVVLAPAGMDRTELSARIAGIAGIAHVEERDVSGLTVLAATPSGTASSASTARALADIRGISDDLLVGGAAAHLADYRDMLRTYGPWAGLAVVLGTVVLLFLFTGSVLLPVKAVLTSALSLGASYGVVVWAFQDGHLAGLFGTQPTEGIDLTIPVLIAAIAFGLSVDYEVFLLSRIREQWLSGSTPERAVAEGLQRTGRIVTSAALLLVVVFAGFLVGGFVPIKELGLGLVMAVALDATIVRMLLVPATMTLARKYNWWAPAPLRRLVPVLAD